MNGGDFFEFSIAHDRKYTLDHLWVKPLDDKGKIDQKNVKLGLSEFIRAEFGEISRIVLSKPEDDSEFQIESSEDVDGDESDTVSSALSSGDELDVDDLLITVRTSEDRILINAPFPCKIVELNGDVEDNPDLVNEDAYGDGWCMIVKPHEWDEDLYLNESEYIEYLNDLD
tara:strand:- start:20 stop:532 length:513 start_codon:yes stop_codon:yes gene_type:complete